MRVDGLVDAATSQSEHHGALGTPVTPRKHWQRQREGWGRDNAAGWLYGRLSHFVAIATVTNGVPCAVAYPCTSGNSRASVRHGLF